MRFLKPTAKPTPRRTSDASADAARTARAREHVVGGRRAAAAAPRTPRITSRDRAARRSMRWPVRSSSPGASALRRPHLDGVEPARRGEPVHLRLVREARLHDAEAAHRAARRVVRAHRDRVHVRVRHPVRARPRSTRRWRSRGSSTTGTRRRRARCAPRSSRSAPSGSAVWRIQIRAGWRCTWPRNDSSREYTIFTGRPVRVASRHACTCRLTSSRAPNAPPTPPSESRTCSGGEAEALGHLVAVVVQPLRRHDEIDAAVGGRRGEAGLGAHERLVLHPDLVRALDHDRAARLARRRGGSRGRGTRCRRGATRGASIATSASTSGSSTS